MPKHKSKLVTSEMMQAGEEPLLFTGGACNIQDVNGPIRNPGRDKLAVWLDEKGWSYFEPQIHPSTHGREYIWELDGPNEKKARELAKLRIYEITATTIASAAILEIMDDARRGRESIVWFNKGKTFAPAGLGEYTELEKNESLRKQTGGMIYYHLIAYVNAGRHLRYEFQRMLRDCPHIHFVDSLEEVKRKISRLLEQTD
jgi:hypothetical protein